MADKYDDIINMPHHVSRKHPHMSMYDRAAQFSPFAALTGHDSAVRETARLTDRRIELDESEKALLDEKLQQLRNMDRAEAEITYFVPDKFKEGGTYITNNGRIKNFDLYKNTIIMEDFSEIKIQDIYEIKIL